MDCVEARRFLHQGHTTGERTPQSIQLGFHLARCPACRAYRERNEALLASLLLERLLAAQIPTPVEESAPRLPVQPAQEVSQSATVDTWRSLVRIGGTCVLIVSLTLLVWLGSKALRTWQNVSAMVVTSVPATRESVGGMRPSAEDVMAAAAPLVVRTPTVADRATPTVLPLATNTSAATATALPSSTIVSTLATVITPTSTITVVPSPMFVGPGTPLPTPQSASVNNVSAEVPEGEPVTILILGNDRRPGEGGVPRTDAIMLARIDPQRGRIALLSFPRDLWVTIPGYGASRINAAYVWGEIYQADGGGLALAKATLSELTGVPIDYVVMADFEGFIGAIDSLDGITVNVDTPLDDPQFPTLDYGYTHAHFDAGPQHMDGITALTYSRIRHPDSDFARIKRQQAVMIALGERLRERGDLQNLLAADRITSALRDYVRTDIPQDKLLAILWSLRTLAADKVERFALEPEAISFGIGDDRYAEVPIPNALSELVSRWYGQ